MCMKRHIIVFDFDGVFSSNFTFHKEHLEKFYKKDIAEKDFYELHSGNVYESNGRGFELVDFDPVKYHKMIRDDFLKLPIVSGMHKVVDHCGSIGEIFIVSSSSECNIREYLTRHHFDIDRMTVCGFETDRSKKIKFKKIISNTGINPGDMIFITDTLGDMREASEVGIASIGVLWGFQRIETLEQGAPFGFAHIPHDLILLCEEYFA